MADCVFCRIASGEMEAEVLHSSEKVVAFRDAHPQAPTHILLVPREHLASLQGLGNSHADMLSELFQTAARLAEEEGRASTARDGGWSSMSARTPARWSSTCTST